MKTFNFRHTDILEMSETFSHATYMTSRQRLRHGFRIMTHQQGEALELIFWVRKFMGKNYTGELRRLAEGMLAFCDTVDQIQQQIDQAKKEAANA